MSHSSRVTLQGLIWPEAGLCTEAALFLRLGPGARLDDEVRPRLLLDAGAAVSFATYFNVFNVGKWRRHCGLKTLFLELEGQGRFEVCVYLTTPDGNRRALGRRRIVCLYGSPTVVPLPDPQAGDLDGLCHFDLCAQSDGARLDAARWQTADRPRRIPDLLVAVTTFRREAAVARTAERFEWFVARSPLRDRLHLLVVDNGGTASIAPSPHVSRVGNRNLGGSGGFARGLLEARARGASHCLFMDDDAAVHMEAIERSWAFLAYADNPATAIAGAVASGAHGWALWENGAIFDRLCRPQHSGLDLRDFAKVAKVEFEAPDPKPHNFYGAWWFFAFPLAAVRFLPFPFFVRGDDVSFSLAHDFAIVTLPGVMSFQEEDFFVKESPLTLYLDLRSHLAHHMALPRMEIGRLGVLGILLRFHLRSLLMCHYDSVEALGLAVQDVLAGPQCFGAQPDLSERRARIGALTRTEAWAPRPPEDAAPGRAWIAPDRWLPRLLMKVTLNGHLLPGFGLIGNRITLPAAQRGQIRPLWGVARLTYLSQDGQRAYTVAHSKARAWRSSLPILWAAVRILLGYGRLRSAWRAGYDELTRPAYWHRALDLPASPEARPDSARLAGE